MGKLDSYATRVLRLLAELGPRTQAQLAPHLAVKRTRIFHVVGRLAGAGLLRPAGNRAGGKGRPSVLWELAPTAGSFLVCYWGTGQSHYGWYDFAGGRVAQRDLAPCASLAEGLAQAAAVIAERPRGLPLLGVQVVVSGIVDSQRGDLVLSNQWGVKQFPLAEALRTRCRLRPGVLVGVENDAHASAFGAWVNGPRRGAGRFVTLFFSPGRNAARPLPLAMGSGMVWDGVLLKGRHGAMGELDQDFYPWLRRPRRAPPPPTRLADFDADSLRRFATGLGQRFAHLVNYLAPDAVVIQSLAEPVGDGFVRIFQQALHLHLLPGVSLGCEVQVAPFGVAELLGGGLACLRRAYFADAGPITALASAAGTRGSHATSRPAGSTRPRE